MIPVRYNITGLSLVVAMGGFLLGFDATVISGAVGPITQYFGLSGVAGSLKLGWAVSCLGWGAMVGNLVAGMLNDRLGRRAVLLLTGVLFLCSAQLAAFATSFAMFVVARVGGGIAVGVAILTAPIYIAEIAPAGRRGALVSLNQLMMVIGMSVSYISNFLLVGVGPNNWRWMLGVQALPAITFLILLARVPESPRWLLAKGRSRQALDVLAALHGEVEARQELAEIQDTLHSGGGTRLRGLLLGRRLRFVLLFALGIAFLQQITGINAIFYYLPTIIVQAGGAQSAAYLQAALVGLVNVGTTVVAIWLIDRVGRRPLLIAGMTGMALALFTVSWTFHAGAMDVARMPVGQAQVVLYALMAYVACFAISLGPVTWVLLSEILPNEQRAAAMSVVGLWNSMVSAGVTLVFPWELARIGPDGTYLGYGLLAAAGVLFLVLFAPETKGRTLEQLEVLLAKPAAT